jgi:hypothetical protein
MSDLIKKRGRKKKNVPEIEIKQQLPENEKQIIKRGRKPKGGKLIQNTDVVIEENSKPVNIILHLRCSLKDLNIQTESVTDPMSYNPVAPPEIMSYENNKLFSFYSQEQNQITPDNKFAYNEILCKKCNNNMSIDEEKENTEIIKDKEIDSLSLKDIHYKLKKLRTQFYKNTINDKKSACFWCTYEFDNEPCYIPKYEMDDTVAGYGCFCRPECAVGFLMNETINDSTKFERYQILNQIYSKVYGFKKNIKPAPSPYYLLDKFYGSLSIQEYRKLLKTEHMLLVLDKPLTRILPELHDDNDEFILNIYGGVKMNQGINSGQFKVKKQSEKEKGPTKNSIMKEKFGIV